jgi:hypothetical protein
VTPRRFPPPWTVIERAVLPCDRGRPSDRWGGGMGGRDRRASDAVGFPTTAGLSALTPRGTNVTAEGDLGIDGVVQHAPLGLDPVAARSDRRGRHRGFSASRTCRTDQGIEANWPKRHPTDTAWSRRHFSLSPNRLSEILTTEGSFNRWLSATAAGSLCHCRRHFYEKSPLSAARITQVKRPLS